MAPGGVTVTAYDTSSLTVATAVEVMFDLHQLAHLMQPEPLPVIRADWKSSRAVQEVCTIHHRGLHYVTQAPQRFLGDTQRHLSSRTVLCF